MEAIAEGKGAKIPDSVRLTSLKEVKGKPALKVQPTGKDAALEDSVIVLTGVEFTHGVIEIDILGKSEPPQSNFLGVAFRIVHDKTYDAVYFRPFNFRAAEPLRKAHAVHYVSHPKNRWSDLRKNKPGQYEKSIVFAPDGN